MRLTLRIVIIIAISVIFYIWGFKDTLDFYFFMSDKEKKELNQLESKKISGYEFSESEKKKYNELSSIKERAIKLGLDLQGGTYFVLQLTNKQNFDAAFQVINERFNRFGLSEIEVMREAYHNRIIIKIPGKRDPVKTQQLISKPGKLEFKLVDEDYMKYAVKLGITRLGEDGHPAIIPASIPKEEIRDVPFDSEVLPVIKTDKYGFPINRGWLVVKKRAALSKDMVGNEELVENAKVETGQTGGIVINFTLGPKATKIFARITREYNADKGIFQRLAIVLDGKIKSAPYIKSEIPTGNGQISGESNFSEAKFLASILKAGSLPEKLKIVEKRIIGPSLGEDSIKAGVKALLIGFVVVSLFMIIYYRLSGIIAVFALIFNLFLLLSSLASFSLTLTLPGIAGIILTVGMSVDANVIIYERIKEELKNRKNTLSSIENGFNRAVRTVADANITTLIAAFVLYYVGSGPIRGFAVTLSIGIIASMFTAIFVSRTIFYLLYSKIGLKKISI